MKKLINILIISLIVLSFTFSANSQSGFKKITINSDLEILQLTPTIYQHISYFEFAGFGRGASNGMILAHDGKAFLFDTPPSDLLTKQLSDWITQTLKLKVVGFVPSHWHIDCMGGLAYLQSLGIDSYANQWTIEIAKAKNLPVPKNGFKDSLNLQLGNIAINCYYPGPGHSMDNIVVWIPSEKVLFAGCLVKELNSNGLGNVADGDLKSYPQSLENVLRRFTDAKIVIPGHGAAGGIELVRHTKELLSRQ